jgi:hypothetical protein
MLDIIPLLLLDEIMDEAEKEENKENNDEETRNSDKLDFG